MTRVDTRNRVGIQSDMARANRPQPKQTILITLPEAARRFGLSRAVVRQAAAAGSFPVYYPGTSWPRCRADEFERWIESTRSELPLKPSSHERTRRRVAQRVDERIRRESHAAEGAD